MERRRFLATTGIALLGGCTFSPGGEDDDTPTATPLEPPAGTPTDPASPDDGAAVSHEELRNRNVVDFETAPLTVALHGRRRVNDRVTTTYGISDPATADGPAVVQALVQNRGNFEQTFALRRIPGFEDPPHIQPDGDGAAVYLAPTENHDLVERVPDVRRNDAGRWRLPAGSSLDWLPDRLTLAPGEAVFGEYHLVGHFDTDQPPLDVGEYRARYRNEGVTIAVWRTDTPGPDAAASRFAGTEVPPLPETDETAWYHEAGPASEVYLEPSAEAVEIPACIEYELHNHSHDTLGGNPYRWGLYKLVDGEWFRIAPWMVPVPAASIPPGDSDESELSLFHGAPMDCEDGRSVGHLGGGRYAYHVGFSRNQETHAALLDLDAPPIDPQPDDDLEVERDGAEIVVTTPEWNDDEHPPNVEVEFERTEAVPDRRLVPEQLPRRPMTPYRNALLQFDEGVERVVLRADRHAVGDTVGYDDTATTVAYGGETFRVTGEDPL